MKLSDHPPKIVDEVITEVRSVKRAISRQNRNDIDRLLAALMAQERDAGIGRANSDSAGQIAAQPAPERPA